MTEAKPSFSNANPNSRLLEHLGPLVEHLGGLVEHLVVESERFVVATASASLSVEKERRR